MSMESSNVAFCKHDNNIDPFNSTIACCMNCGSILFLKENGIINNKIMSLKQQKYNYKAVENPISVYERMRRLTYPKIDGIELDNYKYYVNKRGDIKKLILLIINKLQYCQQTIYLTMYFIDYIIAKNKIKVNNDTFLELIAICCLILACKFVEMDPNVPTLGKFQRYIPKSSLDDILEFEVKCLGMIDYNLLVFTPYDFLNFFLSHGAIFSDEVEAQNEDNKITMENLLNKNKKLEIVSNFSIDIMGKVLENLKYLNFSPFQLALACICIAREKSGLSFWSKNFEHVYNIGQEELEDSTSFLRIYNADSSETLKGKRSLIARTIESTSKIQKVYPSKDSLTPINRPITTFDSLPTLVQVSPNKDFEEKENQNSTLYVTNSKDPLIRFKPNISGRCANSINQVNYHPLQNNKRGSCSGLYDIFQDLPQIIIEEKQMHEFNEENKLEKYDIEDELDTANANNSSFSGTSVDLESEMIQNSDKSDIKNSKNEIVDNNLIEKTKKLFANTNNSSNFNYTGYTRRSEDSSTHKNSTEENSLVGSIEYTFSNELKNKNYNYEISNKNRNSKGDDYPSNTNSNQILNRKWSSTNNSIFNYSNQSGNCFSNNLEEKSLKSIRGKYLGEIAVETKLINEQKYSQQNRKSTQEESHSKISNNDYGYRNNFNRDVKESNYNYRKSSNNNVSIENISSIFARFNKIENKYIDSRTDNQYSYKKY